MEKVIYYLALNMLPNVTCRRKYELIRYFKSVENIFKVKDADIKQFLRSQTVRKTSKTYDVNLNKLVENAKYEYEKVQKLEFDIVTFDSNDYPGYLIEIPDPPLVLYSKGKLKESDRNSLSIVGTRKPTSKGLQNSYQLSKILSCFGITVVSGMAKGIDTAAHRGALENNGRTIAVLGCGLDKIYPQENVSLYHAICENGAIVSEFPLGTPPFKWNFPIRNRIIAGFSIGIVMVEGGNTSGALITAKYAINNGREVYTFPGDSGNHNYSGNHRLIKEGAKLIESAKDLLEDINNVLEQPISNIKDNQLVCKNELIIDDMPIPIPIKNNIEENAENKFEYKVDNTKGNKSNSKSERKKLLNEQKIIYDLLDIKKPKHIDQLIIESNLSVKDVLKILTFLEINDYCTNVHSNNYIKK